MSSEESHYRHLLHDTPRIPRYLADAQNHLSSRQEVISTRISSFLHMPVCLEKAEICRKDLKTSDEHDSEIFSITNQSGQVLLYLNIPTTTVGRIAETLFGGEVREKPVLSGIAQAFCKQIAIAALIPDDTLAAFEEQQTNPPAIVEGEEQELLQDPFKEYSMHRLEEVPFEQHPVLEMQLKISLIEPPDLEFSLEFPRRYTDSISPPQGELEKTLLNCLEFPVTAIAAETKLPLGEIRSWKPGDEIQLPGAEISNIAAVVSMGKTKTTLAFGELGSEKSTKCLRLNKIASRQEADQNLQAIAV